MYAHIYSESFVNIKFSRIVIPQILIYTMFQISISSNSVAEMVATFWNQDRNDLHSKEIYQGTYSDGVTCTYLLITDTFEALLYHLNNWKWIRNTSHVVWDNAIYTKEQIPRILKMYMKYNYVPRYIK